MTNLVCAAVLCVASWERFGDDGRLAASGHRFDPQAMTCATWLYPLGTRLRVTDRHNGLSVAVLVTDRPARRFARTRVDLSPAAFGRIASLELGLDEVKCEVLTNVYAGKKLSK